MRLLRLVIQACACSAEPATAVQLLLHVQYSESALLIRVCVLWNSSLGKEIRKHSINKTGKEFQKLYYGKPRLVNMQYMHYAYSYAMLKH